MREGPNPFDRPEGLSARRQSLSWHAAGKAKMAEAGGGEGGGRTRARTWDPLIKSQLLYQLSYASVAMRRQGQGPAEGAI